MWKLHMGNPLTFLSAVGVYASFPCSKRSSTVLCIQCKHNCPTAHHSQLNSPLNISLFGAFGSFPQKPFQLIKCVWVSMNRVSLTEIRCVCVKSWLEFFLSKKQGNKQCFLFLFIKYWIKASEGPFPVITSLLQWCESCLTLSFYALSQHLSYRWK